ncbi:XdhC family protein [Dyadobacter chenhuakuii]|uniref:XdhC family protein n=1 Tax=Dyadobacter chenhuakuii TaxID=2909339 RepID=A0ABY4XMH3_9BACT|nr:XdhC/CoxI family protein [Dyadobacter chenhuakuii]MCF2494238.1 XdhC family protein [Dyadobacter chenhuakuii]USJ31365.1 XdhC family protein [Dyadobacter chenhuakuii]
MKEITDIIRSYESAVSAGKKTALATVVHVEGSSYRRPGARMLVTDDGQLTGAISGGCLEGDALRKALLAISQQKNKLVTYDTTDDNDTTLGVQLGCNGIVHILFEPIHSDDELNPIALLKKALEKRQNAVVITLFSLYSRTAIQPGTCFLDLETDRVTMDNLSQPALLEQLLPEAALVKERQESFFKELDFEGQKLTSFVEYLRPAPALIIAGAGNDTIPLSEMAGILGWNVTVVDGRNGHATRQRFPKASQVIVAKASEVLSHIQADARTFFVLMTHNYNYDLALLKELIELEECIYIGALGPKKKLEKMFGDLRKEGIEVTEQQKSKIFGPVGLDVGAETSEEIALSVLAEIKAVLNGRTGISLREKPEPIHSRTDQKVDYRKSTREDFLCEIQTSQS